MRQFLVLVFLLMTVATGALAATVTEGKASYYADSLDGNLTASGKPYDKSALTAAHKTLPFGSRLKVTNLANDRSVLVTVNDRGPFAKNRIIDLSRAAAEQLDMIDAGVATVRIELLQ
jgi:rare lipoprotein A